MRALPFEDGAISRIHCSRIIEHFLPADVHNILTEFDSQVLQRYTPESKSMGLSMDSKKRLYLDCEKND